MVSVTPAFDWATRSTRSQSNESVQSIESMFPEKLSTPRTPLCLGVYLREPPSAQRRQVQQPHQPDLRVVLAVTGKQPFEEAVSDRQISSVAKTPQKEEPVGDQQGTGVVKRLQLEEPVGDQQVSLAPAFDWATKSNEPEPPEEIDSPRCTAKRSSTTGKSRRMQKPRQQDLRVLLGIVEVDESSMACAPDPSLTAAFDLVLSSDTQSEVLDEDLFRQKPLVLSLPASSLSKSGLKIVRRLGCATGQWQRTAGTAGKRLGKPAQRDLRVEVRALAASEGRITQQDAVAPESSFTESLDDLLRNWSAVAERQVEENKTVRAQALNVTKGEARAWERFTRAAVYAMRNQALAQAEASSAELDSLQRRVAAVQSQVAEAGTIPQDKLATAKEAAKMKAFLKALAESDFEDMCSFNQLQTDHATMKIIMSGVQQRISSLETRVAQVTEFRRLLAEECALKEEIEQTEALLNKRNQEKNLLASSMFLSRPAWMLMAQNHQQKFISRLISPRLHTQLPKTEVFDISSDYGGEDTSTPRMDTAAQEPDTPEKQKYEKKKCYNSISVPASTMFDMWNDNGVKNDDDGEDTTTGGALEKPKHEQGTSSSASSSGPFPPSAMFDIWNDDGRANSKEHGDGGEDTTNEQDAVMRVRIDIDDAGDQQRLTALAGVLSGRTSSPILGRLATIQFAKNM